MTEQNLDLALRALAHPVRREILWLTWNRWRAASEVAARFPLAQPTVSNHLKVLTGAGLLRRQRNRTSLRYRARTEQFGELHALLENVLGFSLEAPHRAPPGDAGWQPVLGPHRLDFAVRLQCPQDEAYAFFTQAESMRRWLGGEVTAEPEPWGLFSFEIGAKWLCRGLFHELDPPRRVRFSWGFGNRTVPLPPGLNVVEVDIRAAGAGARVAVTHHSPAEEHLPAQRASWEMMLEQLRAAAGER